MAFRGGGRGRGRGGFTPYVKPEPFKLFPEIENFPKVKNEAKNVVEERALIYWSLKLQKFWKSSPYYYEVVGEDTGRRFSDKDSLSDYIRMTAEYVPAELGEKKERHTKKKVRWNQDSDLQRLDFFEKLDQRPQGQEGDKEKKEGENEEEEDEDVQEEDEEYSTDGDYNQNIDFDDDEDDFNMADDNDDEGIY